MPDGQVHPSYTDEDERDDSEVNEDDLEMTEEEEDNRACSSNILRRNKALVELRAKVEDAILKNYILGKKKGKGKGKGIGNGDGNLEEIRLWGVPLLPSKGDHGTDIVLTKFLKAKDFRVAEAFKMLQKTLKWRRAFNADAILEEKLCCHLQDDAAYMSGMDREGHPLCYTIYGAFRDREAYRTTFGTEEKREEFLRWRVQSMEKAVQELSFKPGGVHSVVHITDLKNSPGPAMKDLHSAGKRALMLFQDNYPELIFRNIVINVPFWNFVCHMLHSRFITQRTKSKFIFARPSRVTETLLKYVAPEELPVQYGGVKREDDKEFSSEDKVADFILKGSTSRTIEIPIAEDGVTVVWDVAVVGHGVTYREEFLPEDDCSYNVLIQDDKKIGECVRNSFYINEPGKIVITIVNETYKRKKVFYRFKCKPTVPLYFSKNDQ